MRISILGPVLLSILATAGCGGSDSPLAQTFTRTPDAAFAVRNGTTVDPIGHPGIFDDNQDEAFVEFPLDFLPTARVEVRFTTRDFVHAGDGSDWPFDHDVSVYPADGQVDVADYGSGVFAASFTVTGATNDAVLDVTAAVEAARTAGASHLGLRFHDSDFSQLQVVGAELAAGP